MFGLLDDMNDPRQAGQMALALGLLEAGGPSAQPVGLGQAFARAYGGAQKAFQGAQDRQLERRAADMKMKYLQGQVDEQDATLAEKKKVADFWSRLPQFMRTPEQSALAAGAAEGDIGPTNTNAARVPNMPPSRLDANAMYQAMLQSGSPTLAQTGLQGLAKERPKVKDWQKVNVGGQVLYAPYFEDGTVGKPVPYEVAEKLEFRDLGGTVGGMNPFTGAQVTSARKTQSPDSAASNALGWANFGLSKQRLALDQSNANRLQHVNVDNQPMTFDPRTGRYDVGLGPDGKPLPQAAKPLTEAQANANLFGTRMQQANKILNSLESEESSGPFGMVANNRPGAIKSAVESVPLIGDGLGSLVNTAPTWMGGPNANQQRAEQAQRDFLNAVLRKESGAAISASEFNNAAKQYFPQPGDFQDVIAQKRLNRQLAIQGVLAGVPGGSRVKTPSPDNNTTLPAGWSVTEKN